MSEESPQTSIQARIAALNLGHVGRAPTRTATVIEEDPSERPRFDQRSNSINVAPTLGLHSISKDGIGNEPGGSKRNGVLPPPTIARTGQAVSKPARPAPPPRLPPRTPSSQPSPSLPPRRPSGNLARRDSTESISSTISNISSISGLSTGTARTSTSRTPSMSGDRMVPPPFSPSSLPLIPPKRPTRGTDKQRMPLKGAKSTPSVTTVEVLPPRPTPSLPPRTPARESTGPARRLPPEQPPTVPAKSPLSYGMNKPESESTDEADIKASNLPVGSVAAGAPPVPMGTRPDLSKLQASKPKPQAATPTSCMLCRDFSGPDTHAAKFPRESVPSLDWLATQLVAPFSSMTDRARAIFTWLHHNISYDVDAFFNHTVQPSTPASTLSTGLAVCEGYAGLFTAIATIAGLESVVVGGHGKGYGFSALPPGAPTPPEQSNHAWNAVKIDHGEWKLIDSCWGAGNVNGAGQPYKKEFKPRHFTMSNNEFGLCHFSTNRSQCFRTDGRRVTWEEYFTGNGGLEKVRIFNITESEGLSDTKFLPQHLKIPVAPSKHSGPTVRFQFERVCEHWDPIKHGAGKPYIFILAIHGVDGREKDYVPFETNGFCWWVDVPPQKLGAPGQTITIFTVDTIGGGSGRGLSLEEYRLSKGRKAMSFNGLAAWELV